MAGVLVVTPGAGFALFVGTLLGEGRAAAARLLAGQMTGMVLLSGSIILVFPAVIGSASAIRQIVATLGGSLLIYLGAAGFWSLRNGAASVPAPMRARSLLIVGILNALLNPGLFSVYGVMVPSFVTPDVAWRPAAAALVAIHLALVILWYGFLLAAVGAARSLLLHPTRMRILRVVSSGMLIVLGLDTMLTALA